MSIDRWQIRNIPWSTRQHAAEMASALGMTLGEYVISLVEEDWRGPRAIFRLTVQLERRRALPVPTAET